MYNQKMNILPKPLMNTDAHRFVRGIHAVFRENCNNSDCRLLVGKS